MDVMLVRVRPLGQRADFRGEVADHRVDLIREAMGALLDALGAVISQHAEDADAPSEVSREGLVELALDSARPRGGVSQVADLDRSHHELHHRLRCEGRDEDGQHDELRHRRAQTPRFRREGARDAEGEHQGGRSVSSDAFGAGHPAL